MIGVTGATGQLGRLVINGLKACVPASDIVALARTPGGEERPVVTANPPALVEELKGTLSLVWENVVASVTFTVK